MDRLTQLREYMEKERLDAFYIAKPANVRCISGFTTPVDLLIVSTCKNHGGWIVHLKRRSRSPMVKIPIL